MVMGNAQNAYHNSDSADELRLRLPLQRSDGTIRYISQEISNFPYYLRTNDFSDFFRLAIVQRELAEAVDWFELQSLYRSAHIDHQQLSPEEEEMVQRAFAISIRKAIHR